MEVAPAPAPARVSRPRRYGWSLEDWDEDVECSTPARPVKRVRLVSKTTVARTDVEAPSVVMTPGVLVPKRRRLCGNGVSVAPLVSK